MTTALPAMSPDKSRTLLSIVIPVLDEESVILDTLEAVRQLGDEIEIIAVDGGSRDKTADLLEKLDWIKVSESERGRGIQMNAGARQARGNYLLFLHADTQLPPDAYQELISHLNGTVPSAPLEWGWFNVRLDRPGLVYRLIETAINWRARVFRSPTGDHALFVRRESFQEMGGYSTLPLMEDLDFAKRARGKTFLRIRSPVVTAARRWRKKGICRTILLMWCLRLLYHLGVSPATLVRWYENVR